jgi:hypothetical protein
MRRTLLSAAALAALTAQADAFSLGAPPVRLYPALSRSLALPTLAHPPLHPAHPP